MKLLAFAVLTLAAVLAVHLADRPPAAIAAPAPQGGVGPGTGPNGMLTYNDIPLTRRFTTQIEASSFVACALPNGYSNTAAYAAWCHDFTVSTNHALVVDFMVPTCWIYVNDTLVMNHGPAAPHRPIVILPGSTVRFLQLTTSPLPGIAPIYPPEALEIQGAVLDASWL